MSSSDAVSEAVDEGGQEFERRADSLFESLGPKIVRHAESGNLAAASGAVSLARAGRTFLKGNRKRAVAQTLAGLFWVGVALAQRRAGRPPDRHSGSELSEVVDTSPDIQEAVEPGGRESDHATGEDIVDTTDADLTVSDLDDSSEIGQEAADADVDQRDVATTSDVADVAETGGEGEADGVSDESETGNESETDEAGHVGNLGETGEAGEPDAETGSVRARASDHESGAETDAGAETENDEADPDGTESNA